MLNIAEEQKFAELRGRCRDLGVPSPPEIHIGLKVHDKDGNLTFEDIQRGHSWTRNFYNALFAASSFPPGTSAVFGAGYLCSRFGNGNLYTAAQGAGYLAYTGYWAGSIGVSSSGICIGTSTTAFSAEDYILGAKIAHGTGSGQMSYAASPSSSNTQAYTAGTKTWKTTLFRIFNNNSGGSITVGEVGIISSGLVLFERSVLSPTVAVGNGAQLTVTYEISMDFSAID